MIRGTELYEFPARYFEAIEECIDREEGEGRRVEVHVVGAGEGTDYFYVISRPPLPKRRVRKGAKK